MPQKEREKPVERRGLMCTKTSHVLLKYLSGIESYQPITQVVDKFNEIEEKDPWVRVYGGEVNKLITDIKYLEALALVKTEEEEKGKTIKATELGKYFAELFRTPKFLQTVSGEEI